MLSVEWSKSAKADLLEILLFISERDEFAADALQEAIERSLEHLPEHPYLYKQSFRVPGLREIVVHPNYIVLYKVNSLAIEIANIVHARQQYPRIHGFYNGSQ